MLWEVVNFGCDLLIEFYWECIFLLVDCIFDVLDWVFDVSYCYIVDLSYCEWYVGSCKVCILMDIFFGVYFFLIEVDMDGVVDEL